MGLPPFLRNILIGIPIGITFLDTVGYVARVEGISMQPALNPILEKEDYVYLNRWAIRGYKIERGDIISLSSPKFPNQKLIKRVIGLPGDVVGTIGYKSEFIQVPEGHCWVEGDHTGHSMDSNTFGPISLGLVTAKATCIVWPPNRWQFLSPKVRDHRLPLNVLRVQWDVPGTVFRHGMSIGDVDNDGDNELVVGTAEGELYIFKGPDLWQKITGLGLITSLTIGDIFNIGRNALVVICGDGWVHIFYSPRPVNPAAATLGSLGILPTLKEPVWQEQSGGPAGPTSVDAATGMSSMISSIGSDQMENSGESSEPSGKMECVHVQRIPTNTKVVLLADVDKDGAMEMIIGLTDRVLRSYRWSSNAELGTGRLVGLNKWECTDQIGTVTLQHTGDGTPTLLVAQPGGTFMRIKCSLEESNFGESDVSETSSEVAASCVDYQTLGISRMRNPNISTEIIGDLEPGRHEFVSSLDCEVPKYGIEHKTTPLKTQTFSDDSQLGLRNEEPQVSLEFKRNFSQPEIRNASLDAEDRFRKRGSIPAQHNETLRFYPRNDLPGIDSVDGNLVGGNVVLGEFDPEMEKKSVLPTISDFTLSVKDKKDNNNYIESKDRHIEETIQPSEIKKGKPYALATLDGTIMLVQDEVILWAMQVDHQIFALCRLDVTCDGSDEIVACAWDGQTYILDQQKNSVRFQFEEPVRAFCTGNYSIASGSSSPCLVYNTFQNKIFLYHDVILPSMVVSSLDPIEDLDEEEKRMLDELLGKDSSVGKQHKLQLLTEWLLYGGDYI